MNTLTIMTSIVFGREISLLVYKDLLVSLARDSSLYQNLNINNKYNGDLSEKYRFCCFRDLFRFRISMSSNVKNSMVIVNAIDRLQIMFNLFTMKGNNILYSYLIFKFVVINSYVNVMIANDELEPLKQSQLFGISYLFYDDKMKHANRNRRRTSTLSASIKIKTY